MQLNWIIAALLWIAATGAGLAAEERTGGPYVPTPQAVVDEMLKLAGVRKEDYVIDLGSGDGRIVLTAARRYQARGMGVDIDGELVNQSNAEAKRDGLERLVRFHQRDVLQTRIAEASVLTLYLLPSMMVSLRSKILDELKPGSRVVSHDFEFGEWQPDRKITVDSPDKYGAGSRWTSDIMLWVVPARVEGTWRVAASGSHDKPFTLTLKQRFQQLTGEAVQGERRLELKGLQLDGNRISFVLHSGAPRAAPREFRGVVDGDSIRGEFGASQHGAQWIARRVITTTAR